jgi:hypothetical protein
MRPPNSADGPHVVRYTNLTELKPLVGSWLARPLRLAQLPVGTGINPLRVVWL